MIVTNSERRICTVSDRVGGMCDGSGHRRAPKDRSPGLRSPSPNPNSPRPRHAVREPRESPRPSRPGAPAATNWPIKSTLTSCEEGGCGGKAGSLTFALFNAGSPPRSLPLPRPPAHPPCTNCTLSASPQRSEHRCEACSETTTPTRLMHNPLFGFLERAARQLRLLLDCSHPPARIGNIRRKVGNGCHYPKNSMQHKPMRHKTTRSAQYLHGLRQCNKA